MVIVDVGDRKELGQRRSQESVLSVMPRHSHCRPLGDEQEASSINEPFTSVGQGKEVGEGTHIDQIRFLCCSGWVVGDGLRSPPSS